jgi:hypothetical protein
MAKLKYGSRLKKILIILSVASLIIITPSFGKTEPSEAEKARLEDIIGQMYSNRCNAIISGDLELIESSYNKNTRYGMWAYEYEIRRMKYLQKWGEKQGVAFIKIDPMVVIRKIRGGGDSYSFYLMLSTQYHYVYKDKPDEVNISTIGTYHMLSIHNQEGLWVITKEWYNDPFGDYLSLGNTKSEEIKSFISAQSARDLSHIGERRLNAVKYADTFCGAASGGLNSYKYNSAYKNFNGDGGDCANFASQILYEGGGLRKTGAWNYKKGEATRAWVNADGFNSYMIGSGRASVIAYGSYEKVYKASYKLLPGDYIAYEEKNDIAHISVVTGADSRGYSLVSCHNTDRSHVPWDLGWGGKKVRFYLVRVHF